MQSIRTDQSPERSPFWGEGSATLERSRHGLAPLTRLAVLEATSGAHPGTDLTFGLGALVHDCLAK